MDVPLVDLINILAKGFSFCRYFSMVRSNDFRDPNPSGFKDSSKFAMPQAPSSLLFLRLERLIALEGCF